MVTVNTIVMLTFATFQENMNVAAAQQVLRFSASQIVPPNYNTVNCVAHVHVFGNSELKREIFLISDLLSFFSRGIP